jgi:hypothetical protein
MKALGTGRHTSDTRQQQQQREEGASGAAAAACLYATGCMHTRYACSTATGPAWQEQHCASPSFWSCRCSCFTNMSGSSLQCVLIVGRTVTDRIGTFKTATHISADGAKGRNSAGGPASTCTVAGPLPQAAIPLCVYSSPSCQPPLNIHTNTHTHTCCWRGAVCGIHRCRCARCRDRPGSCR